MDASKINDEQCSLMLTIILRGRKLFSVQYEAMGMTSHYLCYEESFKGY